MGILEEITTKHKVHVVKENDSIILFVPECNCCDLDKITEKYGFNISKDNKLHVINPSVMLVGNIADKLLYELFDKTTHDYILQLLLKIGSVYVKIDDEKIYFDVNTYSLNLQDILILTKITNYVADILIESDDDYDAEIGCSLNIHVECYH